MINNLIAIDTEYNNKREPLSIGISNLSRNIFDEIYIKNKVDKRTYSIHGLPNEFIKNNGITLLSVENKIKDIISNNIIVGFDIEKDFQVLNIHRFNKLYDTLKVIDIKLILNLLNIDFSLSYLSEVFNLSDSINNFLPYHNAVTDAYLSLKVLEKLMSIGLSKGLSEEYLHKSFLKISNLLFFNINKWDIDQYEVDFSWIKEAIYNLEKTNIKKEKDNIISYYNITEGIVFLLNKNNKVIFKIPEFYINKDRLENIKYNIEFKPIYINVGLRFSNFFIKDKYKM